MKKLLLVLAIICISKITFAQTVTLDSVKFYEGKTITVCAKVQSTYVSKGEKKVTYLNFGDAYPNATFVGVIYESEIKNITYSHAEFLKEKNVCLTGKVTIYKEKPQIVITSEDQIKVK